jgi:signal transduction histidine kinase
MHRRRFKRLFHSVFTKLLVTILVTGTAIALIVGTGFALMRFRSLSHLDRNLLLYAEYLTRDLGDPPDLGRAEQIARRTGFAIRFEHPDRGWQTGKIPGSFQIQRARVRSHGSGIWTGHHRGQFFIRLPHAGGELMFITPRRAGNHENAGGVLAFMAAALVVVLAAAYFFIRKVLKPLRTLEAGVKELTAGRLDHRVPPAGDDELQDLAEAFNTMASRLSDLLHGKERLLLDMSHELRSPLTRIKVQLEFLKDEEIREALNADVAEMEAMVTAILEEARLRTSTAALELEPIEISELIRSVAAEFKDRPPGIACGALEPTEVQADRQKIRTLLRNLLDNAVKHSPEDGDPVTLSMVRKNDDIEIIVEDRGEGIEEAALSQLFEPFFRADASRSRKTGGYGLGLSLCKAIVDAHRGRIEVDSAPGRGTRVVATLPWGASRQATFADPP